MNHLGHVQLEDDRIADLFREGDGVLRAVQRPAGCDGDAVRGERFDGFVAGQPLPARVLGGGDHLPSSRSVDFVPYEFARRLRAPLPEA